MVDSDLFDMELDLELMDNPQDDDFGDDDLDLNELVEVAETVEQQHAVGTTNGNISFVSTEEDPIPPPALPQSTACFHPIDPENLRTWIYPINYPIRGYQLNIVQKAMFNNTLVALPTGLGKTFIAAVVMFNYWRWFPNSKIIFMAPTRPLVEQQIEACFTICGLPQQDTVEITGSTTPAKRRDLWKSKRVFFATPQTVQKDIETQSCPIDKVACVVVDEAHRATGNYAYTEVVRKLSKKNKQFRVLALTATPGSNLDAVQNVIDHLHITNIQIRTEDSMDIREFSHGKNIQNIVVKLGYTEGSNGILPRIIDDYRKKVFHPILLDLSKKPTTVIPDVEKASPFALRSARLQFQAQANNFNSFLKFSIISQLLVAESASRAHDLLCQHGVVPFLESVEGTLQELKQKLGSGKKLNKSESAFYHHSVLNAMIRNIKHQVVQPDFIGHPKMEKLVGILLSHFCEIPPGESSKVMIFSSFRSSVTDICNVLDRHRPMIRSSFFVGQSSDKNGIKGLKQSEQQQVIQKFKSDEVNVLVSTSIGEEGLDIGEVDLIICFDSQASPIRMLQRMGRTGRKRKGKCIMLLTESEEKKFTQAKETYARIQSLIARGNLLTYYKPNPAVIPQNYKPTICRKTLAVGTYQPKLTPSKRRKRDIIEDPNYGRDGLLKPAAQQNFVRSFCDRDHNFTDMEQVISRYWPIQKTLLCLSKYVPLQARAKPVFRVGHSSRTLQLVNLIQKCEHRILHPEEQISFHLEPQRQQTKLNLPPKATISKKRRRTTTSTTLDEDFAVFIETNDISHFIDANEKSIADFFLPAKKKLAPPPPPISAPPVKDKGKSKMVLSNDLSTDKENVLFDFEEDFEQEREPSWEPMLPDSLDDNIPVFIDAHQKGEPSNRCINQKTSPYDALMDIEQDLVDPITLPSPPTPEPQTAPIPQPPQDDLDDDSDDLFDFPMDDSFIAQAEALIASKTLSCFEEQLEPKFPFEETINTQRSDTIAFIWAHNVPAFSNKAMQLLEKRQIDIKQLSGQFVSMKLFPQFKNMDNYKLTPPEYLLQQDEPGEDDFSSMDGILEQATIVEQQISRQRASPLHHVISIIDSQSLPGDAITNNIDQAQPLFNDDNETNENNAADEIDTNKQDENEDEEDDFDIDISEGIWANFLENRYSEDEPEGFPSFLFNPETAPSQPQIMSKSFLYADKPTIKAEEDDDNQSFEYIFSQESASHENQRKPNQDTNNKNQDRQPKLPDSDKDMVLIDFDNEDFSSDNSDILDAIK